MSDKLTHYEDCNGVNAGFAACDCTATADRDKLKEELAAMQRAAIDISITGTSVNLSPASFLEEQLAGKYKRIFDLEFAISTNEIEKIGTRKQIASLNETIAEYRKYADVLRRAVDADPSVELWSEAVAGAFNQRHETIAHLKRTVVAYGFHVTDPSDPCTWRCNGCSQGGEVKSVISHSPGCKVHACEVKA